VTEHNGTAGSDAAETVELLRMIGEAKHELSDAMVACGIDPENWGALIDPSRYTTENRRRMADVVQRVIPPLVAQARRTER
jgi:hypothetical protein